jgi:hypothetical protein
MHACSFYLQSAKAAAAWLIQSMRYDSIHFAPLAVNRPMKRASKLEEYLVPAGRRLSVCSARIFTYYMRLYFNSTRKC